MRTTLTKPHRKVLNFLRRNARVKKSEIAKETGMPASTVASSIRAIERRLGARYSSIINCRLLGFSTRAMFVINAKDSLALDFLKDHEGVNTINRIDNDNIFLVECMFRGMKEMAEFTEDIRDMGGEVEKEFHVIEDLKREEFEV